jgi:hypothetical protein
VPIAPARRDVYKPTRRTRRTPEVGKIAAFLEKECVERQFSYGLNLYLLPAKGVKPTEYPTNPCPLLRSVAALCRRKELFTERAGLAFQNSLV